MAIKTLKAPPGRPLLDTDQGLILARGQWWVGPERLARLW